MSTVFQILESLKATQGKKAKQELLAQHAGNDGLKRVFELVNHPYINFYVAKVPKVNRAGGEGSSQANFTRFIKTLERCISKEVRGNDARDALAGVLQDMSDLDFSWAAQIITRKLNCGLGDSSVEKTWPGLVPSFDVSLASTVEWKVENEKLIIVTPIKYPARVEPKWDGYRCVAIKENGTTTLYARSGQVFERGPKIQAWFQAHMPDNFMFDGEIIDSNNWNDTASVLGSKVNHKSDENLQYFAFDCMPLNVWKTQGKSAPLARRLSEVEGHLAPQIEKHGGPVKMAQGKTVDNEKGLIKFYEECLDKGYEGIMIKDMVSEYIFDDRTAAVMKLKPYTDYDCVIIGVAQGNPGAKWADKMVKLLVRLPGSDAITKVGTGTDDEQKEHIHREQARLIGKAVEIRGAPKLTEDGKILFPRFQRYREDWDCAPEVRKLINEVKSAG